MSVLKVGKAPGSFIRGTGIFLAPLTGGEDLDVYASWLNDQETTLYMGSGRFPVTKEGLKSYIESFNRSSEGMLLGIFANGQDRHIGNITLQQIDWRNRTGEIGIILGDKRFRQKGYGKEAIRLVAEHAFLKLNLRKLYAGIINGNTPSLKAFGRIGFRVEGVLREHFYLNGEYFDCLRMGLLRTEFNSGKDNAPKGKSARGGR